MVMTVEAYVGARSGGEGAKLENQVLITDDGCENLTPWTLDLDRFATHARRPCSSLGELPKMFASGGLIWRYHYRYHRGLGGVPDERPRNCVLWGFVCAV